MLVNRNKHFLKWGNKTQNRNFAAVTKLFCNILKFQILPLIRILLVQVLNSKIQCLWEKFFYKANTLANVSLGYVDHVEKIPHFSHMGKPRFQAFFLNDACAIW